MHNKIEDKVKRRLIKSMDEVADEGAIELIASDNVTSKGPGDMSMLDYVVMHGKNKLLDQIIRSHYLASYKFNVMALWAACRSGHWDVLKTIIKTRLLHDRSIYDADVALIEKKIENTDRSSVGLDSSTCSAGQELNCAVEMDRFDSICSKNEEASILNDIQTSKLDLVKMNESNVNFKDIKNFLTALSFAETSKEGLRRVVKICAHDGSIKVLEFLFKVLDPSVCDLSDATYIDGLESACISGNLDVLKYLLGNHGKLLPKVYGIPMRAIAASIKHGHYKCLSELFQWIVNLEEKVQLQKAAVYCLKQAFLVNDEVALILIIELSQRHGVSLHTGFKSIVADAARDVAFELEKNVLILFKALENLVPDQFDGILSEVICECLRYGNSQFSALTLNYARSKSVASIREDITSHIRSAAWSNRPWFFEQILQIYNLEEDELISGLQNRQYKDFSDVKTHIIAQLIQNPRLNSNVRQILSQELHTRFR